MKIDGSDWEEKIRDIENGSYHNHLPIKKRLSIILEKISEEITFNDIENIADEDSINDFDLYVYLVETLADKNHRIQFFDTLKAIQEEIENRPKTTENTALLHRIKDIIIPPLPRQGELFPIFKIQKSVELKQEFALNFGGLGKIEKEYGHLLKDKLSSGLTLQQHIDKVRNWFNDLHGEDLGNWVKLFAYVKSVREYSESNADVTNFIEVSPGRYCFSIKQNNEFFSYFIRPNATKKSGTEYHSTKAKDKFLKWLHDNQSTIEFPIIMDKKVWSVPMRIYEYAENVTDKTLTFRVDTNILESEFKDYVSINIDEIDFIANLWEEQNTDEYKKYRLVGFIDIPLKFLLTLKTIYSRKGEFSSKSGYKGNIQKLSRNNLDEHLGFLNERLRKHLIKIKVIRPQADNKKIEETRKTLLNIVFDIAIKREWLKSLPTVKNDIFIFNINPGYFDKQRTAKRLSKG